LLNRHSQLQTIVGHPIETSQMEGTTGGVLKPWFDTYCHEVPNDPNPYVRIFATRRFVAFSILTTRLGKRVRKLFEPRDLQAHVSDGLATSEDVTYVYGRPFYAPPVSVTQVAESSLAHNFDDDRHRVEELV
jgi:hypothetical protein